MGSYDSVNEPLLLNREDKDVQCKEDSTSEGGKKPNHKRDKIDFSHSCSGPESEVLREVKTTFQLAWPLVLFNFVVLSVPVVTLTFVGHLGELELASASIASSFAMVTAFTVMLGLASTLETLCGQAYGARNYRMMGVYLQSSFIVSTGAGFFILALWMNVATIFKAMGQDPEVAGLAQKYLLCMSPAVFGSGILRSTAKFLQSQGVVIPVLICSFIAMVLHIPACHLFINVLNFGFIGGALATLFTYQSLTAYVVLYTWFSAGLLPNPQLQLSLLSISVSTTNLASMIPIGLGGAAATRVANELGAYRSKAAKLAGKVTLVLSLVSTFVVASSILLARNVWGKAFSNATEVLQSVRLITPLIASAALLDGFQGVLTGIGAYINLVAFYIFGIPSGLYLAFSQHMGAQGLWIGLLVGESIQCFLLSILLLITDWDKMADDAVERVG